MTKARDLADLNFASPELTGVPIAPTAAAGTDSTQIATTAFVSTEVAGIVDTAPETLDTLNELAAALGDDANFSTTVTNNIATKAPLASPTFTGTATVPTLNSTTAIQMGGTEVLNNSRQLSNIASVDATTVAALSAAGVGAGGGTITATADGAISAGDAVALQTDGTVKTISQTITDVSPMTFGTAQSGDGGSGGSWSLPSDNMFFFPTTNQFIQVYWNASTNNIRAIYYSYDSVNNRYTATAGANIKSIDFVDQLKISYDGSSDNFVVNYLRGNTLHSLQMNINVVSGSISGISNQNVYAWSFNTNLDNDGMEAFYNSNEGVHHVVVSSGLTSGLYYIYATACKTSTTSNLTIRNTGTAIDVSSTNTSYATSEHNTDDNYSLVIYRDNIQVGRYKTFAYSDSTGNFTNLQSGTIDSANAKPEGYLTLSYDTTNSKFLFAFADYNGYKGMLSIGTPTDGSGGTLSWCSRIQFDAGLPYDLSLFYVAKANDHYLTSTENSELSLTRIQINSATSVTQETSVVATTNAIRSAAAHATDTDKLLVSYIDSSNNNRVKIANTFAAVSNNTDWIGFASEAISNAASGDILVVGSTDENQTGLTTGSTYYVQPNGSLATTSTDAIKAGRALSATKLLITEGNA